MANKIRSISFWIILSFIIHFLLRYVFSVQFNDNYTQAIDIRMTGYIGAIASLVLFFVANFWFNIKNKRPDSFNVTLNVFFSTFIIISVGFFLGFTVGVHSLGGVLQAIFGIPNDISEFIIILKFVLPILLFLSNYWLSLRNPKIHLFDITRNRLFLFALSIVVSELIIQTLGF